MWLAGWLAGRAAGWRAGRVGGVPPRRMQQPRPARWRLPPAATSPSGTGGWLRSRRCCTPPALCTTTCWMSATCGEVGAPPALAVWRAGGGASQVAAKPPILPTSQPASQPASQCVACYLPPSVAVMWASRRHRHVWRQPTTTPRPRHSQPASQPHSLPRAPASPLPSPLAPQPLANRHLSASRTPARPARRQGDGEQPVRHARGGAGRRLSVCPVLLVPGQPGQYGGHQADLPGHRRLCRRRDQPGGLAV